MSLFSLSSDGGVADMDLAGDFAGVVPSEEPLPGAGVSSERLPPLMVISPLSKSPLSGSLLLACLT